MKKKSKIVNNTFSDNLVFLDTEFSHNDIRSAQLLSLGMVKPDGQELYLEFEYEGQVSKWVKKNVLPQLTGDKLTKTQAIKKIKSFLKGQKPYPVSFVNIFDMVYLYDLVGLVENSVFSWPPIDFASMLFALNIDPNTFSPDDKNCFLKNLGIDPEKYKHHNALDDARLLKEAYIKLFNI